jgi:hypothetical protein
MRFKVWLPLVHTIAMLLITWAPWAPESHKLDIVLRGGREIKTWTLVPRSNPANPLDLVEGINLPAAAVVLPAEFAARRGRSWMNINFAFFGFWIVGLLCWYMIGRFGDDLRRWRRTGALPRKHAGDVVFALLVVPSSILLAGVFLFGELGAPVLAVWSAVWLALSCSALVFRIMQVIRQRRRMPVS